MGKDHSIKQEYLHYLILLASSTFVWELAMFCRMLFYSNNANTIHCLSVQRYHILPDYDRGTYAFIISHYYISPYFIPLLSAFIALIIPSIFALLSKRLFSWVWCIIFSSILFIVIYSVTLDGTIPFFASLLGFIVLYQRYIYQFPKKSNDEEPVPKDMLGRRLLYTQSAGRIRTMLKSAPNNSLSIAVHGEWGSGKTHYIRNLEKYLKAPPKKGQEKTYNGKFCICRVDVWRSSDINTMYTDISEAFASCISGRNVKQAGQYWKYLANIIPQDNTSQFIVSFILEMLISGNDNPYSDISRLNDIINYPNRAVLLILDNLDRCTPDKVRVLFPLIEKLKSIKGLVLICGISYEKCAEKLSSQKDGKKDDDFFNLVHKVFDLSIPIPAEVITYAPQFLHYRLNNTMLNCPNLKAWIDHQKLPFTTPRQMEVLIKRLSFVDDCFLRRLTEFNIYPRLGDKHNIDLFPVFYIECIRLFFPEVMAKLHTHADIQKMIEHNMSDEPLDKRLKHILNDPLLEAILDEMKPYLLGANDHIDYALKQEYLHLSNLTSGECEEIINRYDDNSEDSPLQILREIHSENYMTSEEVSLYYDVVKYAIFNKHEKKCRSFIVDSINKVKSDSELSVRLFYPDLLINLLNVYKIYEKEGFQEYIDTVNYVANNMSTAVITDALEIIFGNAKDSHFKYELSHYYMQFFQLLRDKANNIRCVAEVYKIFACKVCDDICSDKLEMRSLEWLCKDFSSIYSREIIAYVYQTTKKTYVGRSLSLVQHRLLMLQILRYMPYNVEKIKNYPDVKHNKLYAQMLYVLARNLGLFKSVGWSNGLYDICAEYIFKILENIEEEDASKLYKRLLNKFLNTIHESVTTAPKENTEDK